MITPWDDEYSKHMPPREETDFPNQKSVRSEHPLSERLHHFLHASNAAFDETIQSGDMATHMEQGRLWHRAANDFSKITNTEPRGEDGQSCAACGRGWHEPPGDWDKLRHYDLPYWTDDSEASRATEKSMAQDDIRNQKTADAHFEKSQKSLGLSPKKGNFQPPV